MGGTGEYLYNIVFCVQLNNKISEGFKSNDKYRMCLHIIALLLILIIPTTCHYLGISGLNIYGTCSF
jgi:hypothetical protein